MFKKFYKFILPDDISIRKRRFELLIWSFLLALSYYSQWTGFLAWIALVRPIIIISSLEQREAFNAAYFFSFFFNLFALYWVGIVTPPGMVATVVIIGFYYAFMFKLFLKVYKIKPLYGYILFPFLWVGLEYFRTLSEFAFPWSDIGYTQSYYLDILQIVSVTSVHGLSFLIIVINILLVQLFRKTVSAEKKLTSIFVSVAILLGLWSYGWIVTPKYPIPGDYPVAMLQGSVPIEVKWSKENRGYSFNLYDSLTTTVASDSINLYIWPETSAPCYLTHDKRRQKDIENIAVKSDGYHLVGALGAKLDKNGESHFNSCYQVNPEGLIKKRYDKVKLVPFAERVPYQNYLPFLHEKFLRKYLTFIETYNVQWWSDFRAGDSLKLFELPNAVYSVLICFESTFPEFVRQGILDGAEFVVGITNDTWFKKSVGIHMHSRIFLTRMVENRVWGVRVANSGLTYIVDDYGRIRTELEVYQIAGLVGSVKKLDEYSVFTEYGDIIGRISFLITISLIGIFILLWLARKLIPIDF